MSNKAYTISCAGGECIVSDNESGQICVCSTQEQAERIVQALLIYNVAHGLQLEMLENAQTK